MMGERRVMQEALFYGFSLERHVPDNHLLRRIDRFVDLSEVRTHLEPYYSETGRPSIDPDLMIRMLIVGYCFGIRSERRLCDEVHLNLAYRWFCRLGLDGDVPDHSTFSKNRHGRFRESDLLRKLFETVVRRCIKEGIVGGEAFAVDASIIVADAHRRRGVAKIEDLDPTSNRAVTEYLSVLDDAAFGGATSVEPKTISPTDPAARYTASANAVAGYAYSDGVDDARTGICSKRAVPRWLSLSNRSTGAPSMGKIITDFSSVTTVGLDLAKHVFQVHCVDASGRVVVANSVRRNKLLEFFASLPPCLVGLEACGSAHHWARELVKLGHDARLMPPAYVKAYVRRQKNDAADAAAICEAVTRPSMRFVPLRSLENQAALMHHRVREMLVAQRTQVLNAVRGHLAEIGVIAAQGPKNARDLAKLITADEATLPWLVRAALAPLVRQLDRLDEEIGLADDAIKAMAKVDESARRLMSIPGIGPVTASAIAASVQDVSSFSGSREFSAYLGLTPRQNSSGGKERLGRVSKMGNRYLRKLLVVGAHAVLYNRKGHDDALRTWVSKLMETKPFKLVAVALANKLARIAFAVMRDQTPYSAKPFSPAQA